ncbi:MAG: restriction endonuclease [Anaerolineales bacterium]|nr:restriction endonuclease [Anaerolineales bacterium]
MVVALWQRARRHQNPVMAQVDKMSGQEFEDFVSGMLRRQGYKVESVGGYEDMGIDLIATNAKGIRHAVQAKCWNAREVDMSAVRAAVAGCQVHNCHKAVVITNNYFTRRAIMLAEKNDCKLIDRDVLEKELRKLSAA